jgi:hypothetical protein
VRTRGKDSITPLWQTVDQNTTAHQCAAWVAIFGGSTYDDTLHWNDVDTVSHLLECLSSK